MTLQRHKEHRKCLEKFNFTVAAARDGERANKI